MKYRNTRGTVIQVILLIGALNFLLAIVPLIPGGADFMKSLLKEGVSNIAMFECWHNIIVDFTSTGANLLQGVAISVLRVLSLATLETLLVTLVIYITTNLFSALNVYGWPILATAVGIFVGVAISTWIRSSGGRSQGILYAVVNILLLLLAIWFLLGKPKLSRGFGQRASADSFRGFFSMILSAALAVAGTGYATVMAMAAARALTPWYVYMLGASGVFLIVLGLYIAVFPKP